MRCRLSLSCRYSVLALWCSILPLQALETTPTTITTPELLAVDAVDPSCVGYCVVGLCVWVRCTLVGCEVGISDKIRHKNPDFVVSVFNEPGDEPWNAMRTLTRDAAVSVGNTLTQVFSDHSQGGGHRDHVDKLGASKEENSLKFKEANLYGHPAAVVFGQNWNSAFTLWCPSQVTPFLPYFSSALDTFEWRFGLGEQLYPATWIPGLRTIGQGLHQQWGSVFPRTGFVTQHEDAKAAAVIAQRVGNIVTHDNALPHLSLPVNPNNGFNKTWFSGEMQENAPEQTVWKMLAPIKDDQCYAFGEDDTLSRSWAHGRQSDDQRYVFEAWRRYECCDVPGVLVRDIEIPEICL